MPGVHAKIRRADKGLGKYLLCPQDFIMKCLWEPSRTMRRAYADEDTCDSVCGNMAVWPNLKKPHVTCMTLVPVKEELCLRRMCTQGSYGLMGSGAPTMKGNTRTCD